MRNDENFAYVAAWEYTGEGNKPDSTRSPWSSSTFNSADAELQVSGNGKTMKLTLNVWRQKNADDAGRFVTYEAPDVSPDMSFLEMLDVVNEELINEGRGAHRLRPRLPRGHLRHLRS